MNEKGIRRTHREKVQVNVFSRLGRHTVSFNGGCFNATILRPSRTVAKLLWTEVFIESSNNSGLQSMSFLSSKKHI